MPLLHPSLLMLVSTLAAAAGDQIKINLEDHVNNRGVNKIRESFDNIDLYYSEQQEQGEEQPGGPRPILRRLLRPGQRAAQGPVLHCGGGPQAQGAGGGEPGRGLLHGQAQVQWIG